MGRTILVLVFCAAAAASAGADAGEQAGAPTPARVLRARRLVRTVPLVDGHDLQFRRLMAEGLSHTRVAQIAQDAQGFLWFGTQRGLYRYDGHDLRVFKHEPQRRGSLSGVYVYALKRDTKGNLWVGSDGDLDRFDARTERFIRYSLASDGRGGAAINASCIDEDSSGTLWICTRSGLYRTDPGTGQTTVLRHDPNEPASLADDTVLFVDEDRHGALWVGTAAGLDVIDRASLRVTAHLPLSTSIRGMAFHEARDGVFWLIHGADGQLSAFDRAGNTLSTWLPSSPAAVADPVVFTTLLEDRDGTMWFGTQNHGILKFDRAAGRFVRYTRDPEEPHSLSDRRVNVLYQDREGLIWAGLHQSEPNYVLPRPPSFSRIRAAGRASTLVSAIAQDHTGLVWLGLDRGVRTLERDSWTYRDVPGLDGSETTSVVEGEPGVLWIGSAGQGLRQFNRATGRVRVFRHDPTQASSLPSDFVEQVRRDAQGRVWAVTWRGVARWEASKSAFETLMPPAAPRDLTLHTATFGSNGVVWLGSNLGIHRYDPVRRRFEWSRHDGHVPASLSNDRVNSILEAADGSLWIGTQSGLDHWDASGRPLGQYQESAGLPGGSVSCMLEDDAGRLWMSTDRGIARLEPATGRFTAYGTADGLPGVNMTGWDSCTRTSAGEMFFAGFAGATAFHPDTVADRDYAPPTVVTRLRLLDSTITIDGEPLSDVAGGGAAEVTLRPWQSKFSIEFAALSFLSPETNRFRYRLKGLQDEWTEARGDQHAATYMTLPSGTYSFQVEGATSRGPWRTPPATLQIIMLPPWWASSPFFVLGAMVVASGMFAGYRLRMRQLAHAYNARLEERWAERTRIARELHDTLLQSFQGLMFRLQAVRDLLPTQAEKAVPVLEMALVNGEEAIDEARGAVSDLRSSEHVDQRVAARLAAIAAAAGHLHKSGDPPAWELVTTGSVRELHRAVLYEVYQVVREAHTNAYRHARASRVAVGVDYGADAFVVSVADDGVGCDEAALATAARRRRWGVQGMKERMERLGGALIIRSRPGAGTGVELSLPAAVAYRERADEVPFGTVRRWAARLRGQRRA